MVICKPITSFYQYERRVAVIFFHDEIKLTGYWKFYILRTVIKINIDNNKNHFYFCKLVTDLLNFLCFFIK